MWFVDVPELLSYGLVVKFGNHCVGPCKELGLVHRASLVPRLSANCVFAESLGAEASTELSR